jgi:hypothetical protein
MGRKGPQGTDDLRPDHPELLDQKGLASIDFVRLGVAVLGRTTLQDVAYVDFFPSQPHRPDDPCQELPGASHERSSLGILVGPRGLAHKDQFGLRAALAEDKVVPRTMKHTALAVAEFRPDILQIRMPYARELHHRRLFPGGSFDRV